MSSGRQEGSLPPGPTGGGAWHVRFAPNLGFPSKDEPLFRHSAAIDPIEQIRFVADQGFAGVQDNQLKRRSPAVQARMGTELARLGLEMGCFVGTLDSMSTSLWSTGTAEARAAIRHEVRASVEACARTGGRHVTTVAGRAPGVPMADQLRGLVENLGMAAELAERAGIVLVLEPTSELRMPGMLLDRLADAQKVVRQVGRTGVRLVFDVVHIQLGEQDVARSLAAVWDQVETMQLGDMPGRVEPGAGNMDIAAIIRVCLARGYRGLFELEHGLSQPGLLGERLALERLRAIDASVAASFTGSAAVPGTYGPAVEFPPE